MIQGWIKVYRCLLDDEVWNDGEPFDKRSAWLDLLLRAEYAPREGLQRGELYITEAELAERWKWSRGKVRRFLEAKKQDKKVTIRRAANGTKGGTILNIENYTKYQGGRTKDDTKVSTKDGTKDGTRNETNKNNIFIYKELKEEYSRKKEDKEERLAALRRRRDEALKRWEAK